MVDLNLAFSQRNESCIGPSNILVAYNTASSQNTTTIAQAYQIARDVPADNMLGINFDTVTGVTSFYNQVSCTRAQLGPLVTQVANYLDSRPNILAILIIGDIPYGVSNATSDVGATLSSFDAFVACKKFRSQYVSTSQLKLWEDIQDFTCNWSAATPFDGGGEAESVSNGTDYYDSSVPEWPLGVLPQGHLAYPYYRTNMQYLPSKRRSTEALAKPLSQRYPVFNFPIATYTGSTKRVEDLWKKAIGCEASMRTGFGTVLLGRATSSNPTNRRFIEEAAYEGYSALSTIYYPSWPSYPTLSGGFEISEGNATYYPEARLANDPLSAAEKVTGDVGFTTGRTVFLRSQGLAAYYSTTRTPEQPGDFIYEDGAICIHSQSYGATPGPQRSSSEPTDTSYTLSIFADTSAPNALTINGVTVNDGTLPSTVTWECDGTTVTIKTAGVTTSTVVKTGKTVVQFIEALAAAISTFSLGPFYKSRCHYSLRAGTTVAMGCAQEPRATGDLTSYGLFTALWYGSNLAEWLIRCYSGMPNDSSLYTGNPIAWVIYGDPLYRPFGHRLPITGSFKPE